MPGIEPGSHAPEACILPVYYIPTTVLFSAQMSYLPQQVIELSEWQIVYQTIVITLVRATERYAQVDLPKKTSRGIIDVLKLDITSSSFIHGFGNRR